MIEVRVLGPLQVLRDGQAVALPRGKAKQLVALLAARRGAPVTADRLAEELWSGDPPLAAQGTLQAYVSRIRKVAGRDLIVREGSGYRLGVTGDALDLTRFEDLIRRGRALLGTDPLADPAGVDLPAAAATLRDALDLWRGSPLGELEDLKDDMSGTRSHIHELFIGAHEALAEADLASGRAVEVAAELGPLAAENPYRERLWAALALALYGAGRQADALRAIDGARRRLRDDLGLSISEELASLERAILNHDPGLEQRLGAGLAATRITRPVTATPSAEAPPPPGTPVPRTSFVGREADLAAIAAAFATGCRLLTVVGPGGAGKTRLALEALRQGALGRGDNHPSVFVDLAAAAGDDVWTAVADALGLADASGGAEGGAEGGVLAWAESARHLLVIDNCEHVQEAAARVVEAIVDHGVRVLATSRVQLGVAGETVHTLEPLPVPEAAEADAGRLLEAPAAVLFAERAVAADPSFVLDATTAPVAADLVRQLDGLPLAIELAAARLRAFDLADLAARLDDRMALLAGGRSLPSRHQTLQALFAWSWELLPEREQSVLACCSLLAGPSTLATIEAVAGAALDLPADEVTAAVAELVDSSLMQAERVEGTTCYRLLQTVRVFARAHVDTDAGLRAATGQALVAWATAEAKTAATAFKAGEEQAWTDRMLKAGPDLRAAVVEAASGPASGNDPRPLLSLTIALSPWWLRRGTWREGRTWLESAIDRGRRLGAEPRLVSEACRDAGLLALESGDDERAASLLAEAHAGFAEGDVSLPLLHGLGRLALRDGNVPAAGQHLRDGFAAARAVGDRASTASFGLALAVVAETEGDLDEAGSRLHAAAADARATGQVQLEAAATNMWGVVAYRRGDLDEAERHWRDAATVLRTLGPGADLVGVLANLGTVIAAQARHDEAVAAFNEARQLALDVGDESLLTSLDVAYAEAFPP